MATQLSRSPVFSAVRTGVGAVAADSATINDTNYPVAQAIEPFGHMADLLVYWYATGGTIGPFDFLDLQVLYRDVKSSTAQWVEGPVISGIRQRQQVWFPTKANSMIYVRVVSASAPAATDLRVQAASAEQ